MQVFSCECFGFFKNSFFYRTPLVVAFNKEWGKNFQMKEENENISLKLYLQLCKYLNWSPFFSYFFFNFFLVPACSFFVFSFLKGRIHWNFSFWASHEIQFQGHFMKHEMLSWNTFTLLLLLLLVHSLRMFLINKKIAFAEKRYRVKFNRKDIL